MYKLLKYDFSKYKEIGILVVAGGFEDRAISFINNLDKKNSKIEIAVIFKYTTQKKDNNPNFEFLHKKIKEFNSTEIVILEIDGDKPIQCLNSIREQLYKLSKKIKTNNIFVDISGMPHLIALGTINIASLISLKTYAIYTEAENYFPLKTEWRKIVKAWHSGDYKITQDYLLSAALKNVHIIPEFAGIFRPNKMTCLIIFAGFEPNRVEGLVDDYAPSRLIVFYGKSPHKKFEWRTILSRKLHEDLFSKWFVRELEISTMQINHILNSLEAEYSILNRDHDISIAPQNSKMQALASYLFWKKHPDIQLLFTTPVKFNPNRYSKGSKETYIVKLNS